ncbi:hypothetical protein ABIB57_000074 [Devosia sp. UYZn731]|uniref:hypothetical protein n=1 Tax=Devosia sp. UYZn731 TaxID=3156345 RepID=UPI0033999A60
MSRAYEAHRAFALALTPEQQRSAALDWLLATIANNEHEGPRETVGRFLAEALQDLDRGYLPPILRPDEGAIGRGKTRGARANARARAVLAAELAASAFKTAAQADRLVAHRSGMPVKALKRLRENVSKGRGLEVASLIPLERQKWEAQLKEPDSPHETLVYLALTEVGYDRAFHKT